MMSDTAAEPTPQFGAFYRDTALAPAVLAMYQVGVIFRDPTFCDATYKFGGFAAPHRYLIVSAGARCIDALSAHPEWGLCIWPRDRLFKVIARHEKGPHVQITLLDVPEAQREAYVTTTLTPLEQTFAVEGAKRFEEALQRSANPEHRNRLWLDRLTYPLGIDDEGHFFEAWQPRESQKP